MAGPSLASGVKTTIYAEASYSVPSSPTFSNLTTGSSALVKSGNLVNYVTDLGDVTKESNTIGFNVYGTDTQNNVAGFANLGEFTMTIALDETESIHSSLMDGAVGDAWHVGIVTSTGADFTANTSLVLIEAEIGGSALQQSADGVRSFNMTWTLKSSPTVYRAS